MKKCDADDAKVRKYKWRMVSGGYAIRNVREAENKKSERNKGQRSREEKNHSGCE
jgi:hypothetical protein